MRTLLRVPALAAGILVSTVLTGCMSYIAGNQQNFIGNNARAQASSASSRFDRHDRHKHCSNPDVCRTSAERKSLDRKIAETSGDGQ